MKLKYVGLDASGLSLYKNFDYKSDEVIMPTTGTYEAMSNVQGLGFLKETDRKSVVEFLKSEIYFKDDGSDSG